MDVQIVNHVRRQCDKRGIDYREFRNKFLVLSDASESTAKRIYNGETEITLTSAVIAAAAIGVELGEAFKFKVRK